MKTVRLGDVCEKIGSGATPRGAAKVYLYDGVTLIRSQNVHNEGFQKDGLTFIGPKHAAELDGVTVQSGDVLLNITGDSVARVCQVPDDVLPARVNQHVAIVRPRSHVLDPRYLRYFLLSPRMQRYMLSLAGSGGTRNALTKAMIESFEIPLPTLPEQRAIAHILGALDDKIELNRRMNETLEAMARAIFKSWFVDFDPVRAKVEGRQPVSMDAETAALFPDAFEDSPLGKIPRGWTVKDLPDVLEVNPPRSLSRRAEAPYVEMQNMPTTSARVLGWERRPFTSGTRFVNGDVLLARITPCLENGKTAFVDFLSDGEVGWGSTEYIVLRSKPPLPPEYAYFLARTATLRAHAISNMTGTSGRQRIPADCFDYFPLAVPPASVAERFGCIVDPLMAAMKQRDSESRVLAEVRDALLPRLLSGEIRVAGTEGLMATTT